LRYKWGHETTVWSEEVLAEPAGCWRTAVESVRTVRRKEAEVLTAKLTANLSDFGNR
jgi:hypothetical protein